MAKSIQEVLNKKTSIIDNRLVKTNTITQSIIDVKTQSLRARLQDQTLDPRFVGILIGKLSEAEIENLLDYALRKAHNPGRAFVKLCSNVMKG